MFEQKSKRSKHVFEWRKKSPSVFTLWVNIVSTNECVKAIDSQLISAATVNWPQTGLTNTWFIFLGASQLYRNYTRRSSEQNSERLVGVI